MATHKCNKEAEIKEIYTVSIQQAEQINSMDKKMTEIHKTLMGNGRPGLIQDIEVIKAERNFVRFILPILMTVLAIAASVVTALII